MIYLIEHTAFSNSVKTLFIVFHLPVNGPFHSAMIESSFSPPLCGLHLPIWTTKTITKLLILLFRSDIIIFQLTGSQWNYLSSCGEEWRGGGGETVTIERNGTNESAILDGPLPICDSLCSCWLVCVFSMSLSVGDRDQWDVSHCPGCCLMAIFNCP